MMNTLQAVRGMNDILPADMIVWQHLEAVLRELLPQYGFEEMRVPLVEHTELFKRAIGEFTDVVSKEMYTFQDSGGDSLTLRPEATAGVARAVIANNMLRGQRWKLWCTGPMFRHERPQKGRYRQFHQLNVESVGFAGPDADAELIALAARLWQRLGIQSVQLQVNSLGTPESRKVYREKLVDYFRGHAEQLDEDSQRRLQGNPLRILDSKNPQMQSVIVAAPALVDYLDTESREHFAAVCAMLDQLKIKYQVNPRLVRGLDYYTRTVFEWVTTALGSQDAVCSGGRYDGLITQLGGEATPAVGFAMGMERVVELIKLAGKAPAAVAADVYVLVNGERAQQQALAIVEGLRDALPALRIVLNLGSGNFKTQFRRADRSAAQLAVILADDELQRGMVGLKPLRHDTPQSECTLAELPQRLAVLRS
jgi:histidyl-tRNA synthetase